MNIVSRLHSKLTLATLVLLSVFGCAVITINTLTSEKYSLEITQRINRDIALHATEEMSLFSQGEVNEKALKELAHHVMIINPIVEVYLLDLDGKILSHAMPFATPLLEKVDMTPLHLFIDREQSLPIFGDDPRSPGKQKVFSVSPVSENGTVMAYLYTVLNGKAHDNLRDSLLGSKNLRLGAITVIGSILLAAIAGFFMFLLLTDRLQKLTQSVRYYRDSSYKDSMIIAVAKPVRDEIDELSQAIREMGQRIDCQFSALQTVDKERRELIANVSHDLRTPLASIQGYLETILVKAPDLSVEEQYRFLQIVYKNSQRLNQLVGDLFELAKLEATNVAPVLEEFPLMELVQDIVQDYELNMKQQNVTVSVECDNKNIQVYADISLIHRVLENLVQNALRHIDNGGKITLKVYREANKVRIDVIDNGEGIASHEIPKLFDRYYQRDPNHLSGGFGLGLAIVKRIIELHRSEVTVTSELDRGTVFSFWLNQAA